MESKLKLYLYDPRTNISTETNFKYLEDLTGLTISGLSRVRTRGSKMKQIGCYLSEGFPEVKKRYKWYSQEKHSDEAWLIINGSGNQFKVSNYGRVKRIYKTGKERFMMPYQRKGVGNLFIKAKYVGKYGDHKIGHLVAAHFIREPKPGESVIRKNGIITDDFVANLEYASKRKVGMLTGHKSKSMPVVQLDAETMEVVNEYRSAREAARNYFMSYQAILDRCNGVYRQSDGIIWMFAVDYEKDYKRLNVQEVAEC